MFVESILRYDMKTNGRFMQRCQGFSLVEVALAAGMASMSVIALFALLPSGLSLFREATNVTVSAQIAQRLLQEAVQTDYDLLVEQTAGTAGGGSANPAAVIVKDWRYFDAEGVESKHGGTGSPGVISEQAVYHALMRVLPDTGLPAVNGTLSPSAGLATIVVQVAIPPAGRAVPVLPENAGHALAGMIDPGAGIPFRTYTGHVAKIK